MQTLVLGVRQQSGIGKDSGKPYSINPQLVIASPMQPVQSDRLTIRCSGAESVSIDCTLEVFQQMCSIQGSKFPLLMELETQLSKRGDVALTLVTGIKQKAAA